VKTPIDLNNAIDCTLTVARSEWKNVAEVVTDFDASLRDVPCLPGDFNQVILNLVVNASYAIAEGAILGAKGVITVTTRRVGQWAEIRIRDTGSGIPEKIRGRIFDPFFTTKPVGKGTGQGLAIAHSVVVDKHGGTIHFETEMGKGTTFIVRLPLANRAQEASWGEMFEKLGRRDGLLILKKPFDTVEALQLATR
jgi:signal transduction histidine kinase